MNSLKPKVRLRWARPEDSSCVLAWRNEPTTFVRMASGQPVTDFEHAAWYPEAISDPECRFFIIEAEGEAAGQIRYHRTMSGTNDTGKVGIAKVSINITQSMHGRGIATEAFRLGSRHVRATGFAQRVIAHVQRDNRGSIRALEKAGFIQEELIDLHGSPHIVMVDDGDSQLES